MARCTALKRDGSQCGGTATGADGLCWHHDPANHEQRQRNASKAGRGPVHSREVARLRRRLVQVADDVESGNLDPKSGAVAVQALSAAGRLVQAEADLEDRGELEKRILNIERLEKQSRGLA